MLTLIVLAVACALVAFVRLSPTQIQRLRLKPLAIIMLIAAAATPTSDLINDLFLAIPLFVLYLVYSMVVSRIRSKTATVV